MENVRRQVENLLAEEIQAKKDEELVRSLQAQILIEEWGKRDELEKLQDEQRKLLDVERNKTEKFLEKQAKLERQLAGKSFLILSSSGVMGLLYSVLKTHSIVLSTYNFLSSVYKPNIFVGCNN